MLQNVAPIRNKPDYVHLGDFNDSFTMPLLKIAIASLTDPVISKPAFMRAVPGLWSAVGKALKYTSENGRSWLIVPQSKRESFLNFMWGNPAAPRGYKVFITLFAGGISEYSRNMCESL